MRELGILIFNILIRERSFEILQNPRVDIFYTGEDFEGFETAYSIHLS